MTSSAVAWESLTGRHEVSMGPSFTRAWNERIGKTVKRSKAFPDPEYYSLRYNFKPESIDNDNAGTLTPKPGVDGQAVFELERPSLQPGESHRFTAVEQRSKEWECVLLWDPVLQQLTLEKLESTLNLTHEGRGGTRGRPPSSTPPTLPGSGHGKRRGTASTASVAKPAPVPPKDSATELADDLERALTAPADDDAEGEPDEEFEFEAELNAAAAASMNQQEEEEEEEEDEDEMEAVDVAPAPLPPPPPPPVKPKATPKAKAGGKARSRSNSKRDRADDDFDGEVLAFGQPSRPTKRSRRVSTTGGGSGGNAGLALPTPPTQSHAAPTPSELLQPPSSSTTRITYAGSESGSDSDDSDDGGQELGEELDAAALELELEKTLAEEAEEVDDDEGMEAVPIQNGRHDSGRPLSLNELLGGQSQLDDDTSSDDSDDD